jgi:hypothetical protein
MLQRHSISGHAHATAKCATQSLSSHHLSPPPADVQEYFVPVHNGRRKTRQRNLPSYRKTLAAIEKSTPVVSSGRTSGVNNNARQIRPNSSTAAAFGAFLIGKAHRMAIYALLCLGIAGYL